MGRRVLAAWPGYAEKAQALTKRYREQVEVTLATDAPAGEQAPLAFTWRSAAYRVLAVLGHWREDAGWWAGAGTAIPQRDLWRVEACNSSPARGVYELVCEGEVWRLERVWD